MFWVRNNTPSKSMKTFKEIRVEIVINFEFTTKNG